MPLVHLETFIKAPPQVVFDLSRSVDLHKSSMRHYNEEVIAGINRGLMEKGDTVTWKAKHLFANRILKVVITEMNAPAFFADEMLEGNFKTMRHEHSFKEVVGGTVMRDDFYFESPFGLLGRLVNQVYLKKHMRKLLQERNAVIKHTAETGL